MSLVDAFAKEDRTEVKFSQFFALAKQVAQYETVMNAVNCDVPHRFIRETMTGKKEEVPEIPEKKRSRSGRCEGGLRRGRVQKDFAGSHRRDQSEVRTGRGRSRTGAGSTGKRAAGNYRRKYSVCNFGDYRKQREKWSSARTGRRNVPDRFRTWNSNFEKLAGRENTA